MNLNFDEKKKSNSGIKITIGIVILTLIFAGLGYSYKKSSDAKVALQKELIKAKLQKEVVINDLTKLKIAYDSAIVGKTVVSYELITERDKVKNLINNLRKSKVDTILIVKFKKQYYELEAKMKEIIALETNIKPTSQHDNATTVLEEPKTTDGALTIQKTSSITVQNLKTFAYKAKGYGNQQETDNDSSADMLKISFTITQNNVIKSGDKQYYIQIVNNKNNVLGYQKTESFDGNVLTYSFLTRIKNPTKTVQVLEDLPGKDFHKGTYFVNVFDKDILISKISFVLR